MTAPEDAASVVLARFPFEICLTLRPRALGFAGGYYVFPGGRVDPEDRAMVPPAAGPPGMLRGEPGPAFAVAAIRETYEEVGLLLAYDGQGRPLWTPEGTGDPANGAALETGRLRLAAGQETLAGLLRRHRWRLAWDRLHYIGRWVTPPAFRRRFDTRFFLVDVTGSVDLDPSPREVERVEWFALDQVLALAGDGGEGGMPLMPPTLGTVHSLSLHSDVEAATAFFSDPSLRRVTVRDPEGTSPLDIALASVGVHRIPVPSATLKPWSDTNVYLIVRGDEALVVDGGDGGEEGAGRVHDAWVHLGRPRVGAIAFTHSHPDHCRGAVALARALGDPPVWAHPLEKERLEELASPLKVNRLLQGGETLGLGSLRVEVLHTPGHSPGHLAFWLPRHGVIVAGDVAVAKGSVWVGPPDGSIRTYLQTLERLRSLPLRLVAPGHGPPFTDPADRLAALIRRRQEREEEIVRYLARSPASVDDLVAFLYGDQLEPLTLKMARRTVLAHLEKLAEEGRVVVPDLQGSSRGLYRVVDVHA